MDNYRGGKYTNTKFFSSCNPDMIEHCLVKYINEHGEYLKKGQEDAKVNKDTYKIKFNWTTPNQSSYEELTKICVRILKVEDQERKYCVEFTKIAGNQTTFQSHLGQLKTELDWANDATLEASKVDAELAETK